MIRGNRLTDCLVHHPNVMATRVNRKNAATAAASSKEIVNTEKGAIKTEPGIDVQSNLAGPQNQRQNPRQSEKDWQKGTPPKRSSRNPSESS
ncbi:hypothetical protein JTB14_011774 [Gonioctena quinquepunctata]|nr:hypothetical protein JTB14_011774 [Gonioctena quinquepunctata]